MSSSPPPEIDNVDVPVSEEEQSSPPVDSVPTTTEEQQPAATENPPVPEMTTSDESKPPASDEEETITETVPAVASETDAGTEAAPSEADTETEKTTETTTTETAPVGTPDKADVELATADSKLKFQYVKDDNGKVSLQVAPAAPRSTTPKKSSKTSSDRKSKKTSSTRSRSPTTPTMPGKAGSSQTPKTPKPKMDLRHILAKHEKKKTPVAPAPASGGVDFYGSMSAIPFLKPKTTPKKTPSATNKPRPKTSFAKDGSSGPNDTPDLETSASLSPTPKPRLPTREEIVAEAQYDEAQLHLWKSMSALDSGLGDTERPADFLPMMPPAKSPKQKNLVSPVPANNKVRAFRRPGDYLNPDLKSPQQQRFLVHVNPEEAMEETDILPLDLEK